MTTRHSGMGSSPVPWAVLAEEGAHAHVHVHIGVSPCECVHVHAMCTCLRHCVCAYALCIYVPARGRYTILHMCMHMLQWNVKGFM